MIHKSEIIDTTKDYYLFDVIAMGAVRMTQSDKWKTNPNHPNPKYRQRKAVAEYFKFKTTIEYQKLSMKYELGNTLDILFAIPMPDTWSEKKKKAMNGKPCLVKPDIDNLVKAFVDACKKNDSDVWWVKAEKRWARLGSVVVYKTE